MTKRRKFKPEEIISKLREAEVMLGQGKTVLEAHVLIERWRIEYNTVRPHSSLGYRPPAPEAVQPVPVAV